MLAGCFIIFFTSHVLSALSLLPPLPFLYASLIIQSWQFLLSSGSSDPGMLWPGLGSLLPPWAWWRVQPPGLLFAYSSLCGSYCLYFVSFKGYTDLGNAMWCSPDSCFDNNFFFQYQYSLLNTCSRNCDEPLSGCGFTPVCVIVLTCAVCHPIGKHWGTLVGTVFFSPLLWWLCTWRWSWAETIGRVPSRTSL